MHNFIETDTNAFSKRIIRSKELRKILGISNSTLWQFVKKRADFPKPLRIGDNSVGWLESEVNAFIDSCASARKGA